jgi:hypothetical protein
VLVILEANVQRCSGPNAARRAAQGLRAALAQIEAED